MIVEFRSYDGRRENTSKYFRTLLFLCILVVIFHPLHGLAQEKSDNKRMERDGQHDFDFEIGTWKTRLSRLLKPLTGSTTWVEYEGITVVRKVWNGRANLVELVADGPAGHIEALSLRLYNPQSKQWSLNFANSQSGTMSIPTIGEFKNGRGEFYNQETLNGRAILVRFVISDMTPISCRFEQAFSEDGGKTWEVNWIATDTPVKDASIDLKSHCNGFLVHSSILKLFLCDGFLNCESEQENTHEQFQNRLIFHVHTSSPMTDLIRNLITAAGQALSLTVSRRL